MRPGTLLIVWLVCAATATSRAAPHQVEIRAQTKIVLDQVRLAADGVAEVRGQLLDNLTGEGLGGQKVRIRSGGDAADATTAPDGRFRTSISVTGGPQTLELEFAGSALMNPSQTSQLTDPARAQVALAIDVEDAPAGVNVTVTATVDDQPIRLPVVLSVGPPASDRLGQLASVSSGTPFLLTRKAAGGAGNVRVRAAFAGDDVRQAASAEKTVELAAGSTTTMAVSSTQIAYEEDLGVTGRVTDDDGRPVALAAVALISGDRRLAQGATAGDGSYRFKVEGEVLGEGQWGIGVRADPGPGKAVKPSRSNPEIIRVSAPEPVPVSYTIAAFLATALAAGGFFTARARPWHRLRRQVPPADMPVNGARDDEVDGGLVAARPGLVSTLRRPSDDGFSGAVRDTVRGRPVAGAVVRLRLHHADREVTTGADGSFAFEGLALGEWVTEVVAPGHITETFAVSIPHRGELRAVRVDLVPVRERVFQLYRRAAEPILPEPRLWGVWSPRQIVDHVRSKRPTPALAELTSFVEEIYFSPREASETILPLASAHVERAVRESARAPRATTAGA